MSVETQHEFLLAYVRLTVHLERSAGYRLAAVHEQTAATQVANHNSIPLRKKAACAAPVSRLRYS